MKLNRLALFSLLVVVVLTSAFASVASAGDALLGKKLLRWEVSAGVYADTTFLTDESDTTRTEGIDTSDWDWDAIAAGQLTGGNTAARVVFESDLNNGVSDTLYYTVELGGYKGFGYNGSIVTTYGNSAVAAGGTAHAGAGVNVWTGALLADTDSYLLQNIWMIPSFRLRVVGDQSGTTPKISGLKCYVLYPQRAASK
jgi:hypothetical protein